MARSPVASGTASAPTAGWSSRRFYALAVPAALVRMSFNLKPHPPFGLDFWLAALCRFAIALVLLILLTFLMGATPSRSWSRRRFQIHDIEHRELARHRPLHGNRTTAPRLFPVFQWLGIAAASCFGALLDLAVGIVAVSWLAPRMRRGEPPCPPCRRRGCAGRERCIALATPTCLVVYALVGFTALVYEAFPTRALAMVLGGSIHGFAVMPWRVPRGHRDREARHPFVRRADPPAGRPLRSGASRCSARLRDDGALSRLSTWRFALIERWGATGGAITALPGDEIATLLMLPATLVLGALMPLLLPGHR